jgi:hypothetical protein
MKKEATNMTEPFEPIEMTEEAISQQARAKADARAKRASDAINQILQDNRCKIVPIMIVQAGQIVQHATQVVPE